MQLSKQKSYNRIATLKPNRAHFSAVHHAQVQKQFIYFYGLRTESTKLEWTIDDEIQTRKKNRREKSGWEKKNIAFECK